MVNLLSSSTVSKYLEFRATTAVLQCNDGQLGQVTSLNDEHKLNRVPFNRYLAHGLTCFLPKQSHFLTKER